VRNGDGEGGLVVVLLVRHDEDGVVSNDDGLVGDKEVCV